MKQAMLAGWMLGCVCVAVASGGAKKQVDTRVPVKLPIHHADPWAVKALIEGTNLQQPELSSIWGVRGGNAAGNNSQTTNSPLLKDGYLVVNPTDNSLWWYPKKP